MSEQSKQGQVCPHGQLVRSCPICERDATIQELRDALDRERECVKVAVGALEAVSKRRNGRWLPHEVFDQVDFALSQMKGQPPCTSGESGVGSDKCPDCGEQLIAYASYEHYVAGDW